MNQDTFTSIITVGLCLLAPIVLVIFGFVGRAILVPKGYSGVLGFILGAVGGIIGIVVALIMPQATQPSTQSPMSSSVKANQRQISVSPSPTAAVGVSQPLSNMSKIVVRISKEERGNFSEGIDFLLDGESTGLIRFGEAKEFEIPVGTHVAKAKGYVYGVGGVNDGASHELKFTVEQGQIFYINCKYSSGWGMLALESATSIEFPYGCPECATENFDKVKAHRFVPIPIKGVPPFSYSCPKCGYDWKIISSSFYHGGFLFYSIGDCPHCGNHLSLYRFPGAGEEPIQRDYCMHCGFYKRD